MVLLRAALSVVAQLDAQPTLLSVLTDNQGLATSFVHIKPRTPALFHEVAQFRDKVPSYVTVEVTWQPRNTPLAQLADQLSKVGRMFVTTQGTSFLRSLVPHVPPVLIDPRRLLLVSRHWISRFHNSPQLFLIHPCTFVPEIRSMFSLFQEFQAQGLVISPFVPTSFRQAIISQVSSQSKFFTFDFNPSNSPLFVVSL